MMKPSPYYRTWWHWRHRNEDEEWPKRWALIPLFSYLLVRGIMDPIAVVCQKLVPLAQVKELSLPNEEVSISLWRQKLFATLYFVYDHVRHYGVDRYSIRFIDNEASWPQPESSLMPRG